MNWRVRRGAHSGARWLCIASLLLLVNRADALPRYGPLEAAGSIAAQQLIRFNRDIDQLALVQQRNTLKLRVDYQLFERGKLINKLDVPFIERGKLFLLYRGVYDSVYDTAPGFEQRDIWGQPIRLRLDDLPGRQRDDLKYENRLREAFGPAAAAP